MKICPKCDKIYEDSQNFCPEDGAPLELTAASKKMREEAVDAEIVSEESKKPEAVTTPVPVPPKAEQEETCAQEQAETEQNQQSQSDQQQANQWQQAQQKSKGFDDYIKENIPNSENWKAMYLTMDGRLTRAEFRSRWLILIVLAFLISLVCSVLPLLATIGSLALLAISIMQLTIAARRLHDTNHSAWWLLLMFIPGINFCLFIYLLFKETNHEPNQYGPARG